VPPLPVSTQRLALTPLQLADVDAVFRVFSDAATWRHLPSGRHTDREQSRRVVEDAEDSWVTAGLGPWAIRVTDASASAELPAGTFIGTGGVTMTPTSVWNLGYRLSPESWGRGFATEVALAAVDAAAAWDADRPITARVMSNNPASGTVALRAGLSLIWEGPSTAAVKTGTWGQIYSDRDVSASAMEWLIANV
jgi:RimJ/RimL family protein N-acetyltransferase